jgi:hypothetical protein
MARELAFPRTRYVALSALEQAEEAKAEGGEAILVPIRVAAEHAAKPPSATPAAVPGTPEPPSATPAAVPGAAEPPALPRAVEVDISEAADEAERCQALDGSPAPVRCASSLEGRQAAGEQAAAAAQLGEAVLLSGLDRWYRLGREGAGYCRSCELTLVEFLRESYGDQLQPFDALETLRSSALPPLERPFARQKEALRLSEAIEAGKRAVLRARDEARRSRGVELPVLGRVGPLSAVALELSRHLDGLIFELPSLEPMEALLPLLAARAALGVRPAVAVLPEGAEAGQVRLFAALAAACDTDLLLPTGASAEARTALAVHRTFLSLVRERYRATAPLVDAEILFSARCDHWTAGAHQRAASASAAALAQAQLQPAVRLDLSGGTHAPLLILAGAGALPESDAAAARRHVEAGGDLLLAGKAMPVDDEGRIGDPLFPEVKSGLDRVGEGRVYALEEGLPPQGAETLSRALRELAGRGRSQITVAGRGKLFSRAYLDPERKLDVHLVNLDLRGAAVAAAQGVQLTIAGQAAGGGRSGYWFAPERDGGKDGERITLNPSGFSVSTILPSVDAYALLAVPR